MLLRKGVNVNISNAWTRSTPLNAVYSNYRACGRELSDWDLEREQQGGESERQLLERMERYEDILEMLLREGADACPDIMMFHTTPLWRAISFEEWNVVRLFVRFGAHFSERNLLQDSSAIKMVLENMKRNLQPSTVSQILGRGVLERI